MLESSTVAPETCACRPCQYARLPEDRAFRDIQGYRETYEVFSHALYMGGCHQYRAADSHCRQVDQSGQNFVVFGLRPQKYFNCFFHDSIYFETVYFLTVMAFPDFAGLFGTVSTSRKRKSSGLNTPTTASSIRQERLVAENRKVACAEQDAGLVPAHAELG